MKVLVFYIDEYASDCFNKRLNWMANLYKYMSADIADVLLVNDNQFSIKFSHLHEYNDPYEFFLTIDYQRPAQELAF